MDERVDNISLVKYSEVIKDGKLRDCYKIITPKHIMILSGFSRIDYIFEELKELEKK